jgi:signal peptidase II
MSSVEKGLSLPWAEGLRSLLYGIVLLANYAVDRITKSLAVTFLRDSGPRFYIDGLLILTYAENDGAFLGMGGTWPVPAKILIFIALPISACAVGIVYAYRRRTDARSVIALLCIIGGGIGNLQDRILNQGSVVDFLNFGIGNLRTGILNAGDLSVTFGALAFAFLSIRKKSAI